jgi:predicted transcriptional regulator
MVVELNEEKQTIKEKVKNESKKFRNPLLIWRILKKLEEDKYPAQVARELRISKQLCWYYIKKLEKEGYIKRKFRSTISSYEILPRGKLFLLEVKNFSASLNEPVRVHALAIKLPILKDNPQLKLDREIPMNNWVKKFGILERPFRILIEKTPSHVIIYPEGFTTRLSNFLSDYFFHLHAIVDYAASWLAERGIVVTTHTGEIRQHIATKLPEFFKVIGEKTTNEIELNRRAKGFYPSNDEAKIWMDKSK